MSHATNCPVFVSLEWICLPQTLIMKKNYFLFSIFLFISISAFTQTDRCGSINPHPSILQEYSFESSRSFNSTYIIPVVFHIYYDSTIYNGSTITTAEIDSILMETNRRLNLQSPETAFVVPYFQPVIGNISVELRRASLDTNGNCFNGIIYHNLVNGLNGPMVFPNYAFNPNHYLNVHINQAVNSFLPGAFAYFPEPYSNPANQNDGIIFRLSSLFNGKTMVHEVGHFLGLLHTFGLTNTTGGGCGNDFVSDTPPTNGSPGDCNTATMICTPGVPENVQNHMDYSDDPCRIMFTAGQAGRVDGILNDLSLSRKDIWQLPNLIATGVDTIEQCNMFSGQIIYQPNGTQSCSVPEQFNFVLWSKYSNPDSVLWTTSEGIISNPENEEITITFGSQGAKLIGLTCYYGGTSYVYTKTIHVNTLTPNGLHLTSAIPYRESFENGFSFPDYHLKIQNNSGSPWQLRSGTGFNSDSCLYIPIEAGTGIDTNTIVIGTFNLLNTSNPHLSFKISTSKNANTIDRKLILRGRSLCTGDQFLYKFDYDSLFALNNISTNFFPSSDLEWKTIDVHLDPYFMSNYGRREMEFSVQLIKYFEPGSVDENVFIDHINLSDTTESLAPIANLSVSNYHTCSMGNLEFSEQCSNLPDSVKWYINGVPTFGNPTAYINGLSFIPNPTAITLKAYNNFGFDSITKYVYYNQVFWTSLLATPGTICQGDTAQVQASFINADTYVWSNYSSIDPNQYILSNNDTISDVNPNSTQIFQITASNIYGCTGSGYVQVNVSPLPYVNITAPGCVFEGSTIELSTPFGTGFTYNWSPATGLSETDTQVIQAFIDSTITYQVTATHSGCSFSQTTTIYASPSSSMVSLTVADTALCSSEGTMIYASAANGASILWGMNPCCSGTFTPMNDSFLIIPFFDHTVYYAIATDTNGCVSTDSVEISFASNPTDFYVYPFEYYGGISSIRLCVNEDSVTMYTVDNGTNTYQWSSSSGAYFTNVQNNRATFHIASSGPPFYPVFITALSPAGCTVTKYYQIEKYWGSIEPIYSISPPTPTICEGESVAVTLLPGGNYYYYYWVDTQNVTNVFPLTYSNFIGNTGNGNTATLSPDTSSHYTYLVYDYFTNCVKTRDYFVNVNPAPDLVLTISDQDICEGDTTTIIASGASSFAWTPSSNIILSGGNTIAQVFPNSTDYYSVLAGNGICTTTDSVLVQVFHDPIVNLGTDTVICAGSNLIMYAGGGAFTFLWSDATTIQQNTFNSSVAGNYIIWVDVMNAGDCVTRDSILITVQDCSGATQTIGDPTITIYPNPADQYLIVESSNVITNVELLDITGRKILVDITNDSIFTGNLSNGIYVILIQTTQGNFTRKVEIMH